VESDHSSLPQIEASDDGRRRWFIGCWVAAIALCICFGLSHSFTMMAKYDDESYVMLSLQTFFQGERLYEETYTQYGPAYYLMQSPIHRWLEIPITHDIVRLKTVFSWFAISLLSGVLVWKITGKKNLGITGMLLVMLHLEKLGLEPAHPQEIISLLAATGLILLQPNNRLMLLVAGLCAAFAGLTKLNVGATMAASFLFAVTWNHPNVNRHDKFLSWMASFLCCSIPAAIGWLVWKKVSGGAEPGGLFLPFVLFLSTVTVCWMTRLNQSVQAIPQKETSEPNKIKDFYWVIFGGAIGSIWVVIWAMQHGNNLREILWGVLLQHSFMSESFYQPLRFQTLALLSATIFFLILFSFLLLKKYSEKSSEKLLPWVMVLPGITLVITAVLSIVGCFQPIEHGLNLRGAASFLAIAGPMVMPVILINKMSAARLAVAMSGCLFPILVFPTPGTQASLGTIPIILGLLIGVADAAQTKIEYQTVSKAIERYLGWTVALAMIGSTFVFSSRWTNQVPLNQPGCSWVRLEASRAIEEQQIAEAIRNAPGEVLAFATHNHNRFFFWTDKTPATSINPTFWPWMLTEEQSEKITRALSSEKQICVVMDKSRDLIDAEPDLTPLSKEMSDGWKLLTEIGQWQVGVRTKTTGETGSNLKN